MQLQKAIMLERLGDDEELLVTMADMYVGEADNYCRQLNEAADVGDLARLQMEAHTLKSLLATFVDDEGALLALEVEKAAKEGRAVPVAALCERVQMLAAALREAFSL